MPAPLTSPKFRANVDGTLDLILYQGGTWRLVLAVQDETGTPSPLTGWTGRAQARAGDAVINFAVDVDQAVAGQPTTGEITLSLTSAETDALNPDPDLEWTWDLELVLIGSDPLEVDPVCRGEVEIVPEVTQP